MVLSRAKTGKWQDVQWWLGTLFCFAAALGAGDENAAFTARDRENLATVLAAEVHRGLAVDEHLLGGAADARHALGAMLERQLVKEAVESGRLGSELAELIILALAGGEISWRWHARWQAR